MMIFRIEANNRDELMVFTDKQQCYKTRLSGFDDTKASALGKVMMLTPWVFRVALGFRLAVWKIRHRPSEETTAASKSSRSRKAAARGDLSE